MLDWFVKAIGGIQLWPNRDVSVESTGGTQLHKNARYSATVNLGFFEQAATNAYIADLMTKYGFTECQVSGSGQTRLANGRWSKQDMVAPATEYLSDVTEMRA